MAIRKLKNHAGAQAHIEEKADGTLRLYSYNTMVAKTDSQGYVYVRGEYSRTTMNHIRWFLSEIMGVDYTFGIIRTIFFGAYNGIHTENGDLTMCPNINWAD